MEHTPVHQEEFYKLVEVSERWRPYVEPALVRLGYTQKNAEFTFDGGAVWVRRRQSIDPDRLRAELLHSLYREKIFQETMPMRTALYSRLFG